MHDLQQIRRTVMWGIPLSLGIAATCAWLFFAAFVPMVQGIGSKAMAVRIAPAAQLAPFVVVFCLLSIVVGGMRAVPCREDLVKRFERAFNIAAFAGIAAMVLIPLTSVAQRFYMPSIGYEMCSELQGHPTMWFTDWVRDPAWCVKGKSLEWVNEQASTLHVKP
ncbi:hypothetical protein [Acidovorax sp. BLS4]|uniref:hypothetical protein n=1 Tax=Acidovorax sp. BLS4 TaxID=3273430 RepID=UPI0029439F06|nr:hypothetical protein [Paracidovorax avenae]WOI45855.1 hypothetical protein R1Z03_01170 [Paracidovorax avenae]